MDREYQALRSEMLKWQDRRFDLLKLSISVITGLLGFKLIVEKGEIAVSAAQMWPLISSVLLLYLSAATLLTWYAGVANSKAATYIKVFHEEKEPNASGWETRLKKLKDKGLDPQNLNQWITVVYLVLAAVSILLPYAAAKCAPPTQMWLWVLVGCAVPFLVSIFLAHRFSYPRERYEEHWRSVLKEEQTGRA